MSKFFLTLDELGFYLNFFVRYNEMCVVRHPNNLNSDPREVLFYNQFQNLNRKQSLFKNMKQTYKINVDMKKNNIMEIFLFSK